MKSCYNCLYLHKIEKGGEEYVCNKFCNSLRGVFTNPKEQPICDYFEDMDFDINAILNKEDVVNLLLGFSPTYKQMSVLQEKGFGYYTGGNRDHWTWKRYAFDDFTTMNLFSLYSNLKEEKLNQTKD